MNCYASGLFGLSMLGATVFTMSASKDTYDQLTKLLSPKIAEIYNNIAKERRNHYIQGLFLGFAIAYMLLNKYPILNEFHKIAFSMGVIGLVSVLYYFLMPKSDYMLNHLKTEQEIKAWLEIYKTMKHRYFMGFIFGLLSAIPITTAMC
jgi:hypothetical protein